MYLRREPVLLIVDALEETILVDGVDSNIPVPVIEWPSGDNISEYDNLTLSFSTSIWFV